MNSPNLPKLIATSVVRGSEQGQSHGGVYTIDFSRQEVLQHIDWNSSNIDFSGRGWDRGLRGIEFGAETIYIAASDELFCYNRNFELITSFRCRYLKHCHEISRLDDTILLTSTGFDSLLAFDIKQRRFSWGLQVSFDGLDWHGQVFDPASDTGPAPSNEQHLNMVKASSRGIFFSGLKTRALLALEKDMSVTEICSLPLGTHNAQPFQDGILFNDTESNAVRYVSRNGEERAWPVPEYPEEALENRNLGDARIARQRFGRGLCVVDDFLVAAGSSPSTITLYNLATGQQEASVNLSMDIRNAIHGLELWPFKEH